MAIPNLIPLIKPLTTRFPSAWEKCKHPHDDGEFNARVASVLYYEHGLTLAGRNGKRGNPNDLSKDIINWRYEGNNFDPTNSGLPCTIIDFIASHESPQADITQFYPDPNGPGAWVQPLTLAQIDAGQQPIPPQPPSFPYPDENTTGKAFQARVKQAYTDANRLFPDPNDQDAFRHFMRYGYSSHEMPEPQAADKHISELRTQLGVGPES